jgi:hypothetical protein
MGGHKPPGVMIIFKINMKNEKSGHTAGFF